MKFAEALTLIEKGQYVRRAVWDIRYIAIGYHRQLDGKLIIVLFKSSNTPTVDDPLGLKGRVLYDSSHIDIVASDWEVVDTVPKTIDELFRMVDIQFTGIEIDNQFYSLPTVVLDYIKYLRKTNNGR